MLYSSFIALFMFYSPFIALFMLSSLFIALFMLYSPFIALFMLSSLFIALLCFIVHLSLYLHLPRTCAYCVVIIPPPCIVVRQSRVALVDYVSPLRGLNNHVSPRGT